MAPIVHTSRREHCGEHLPQIATKTKLIARAAINLGRKKAVNNAASDYRQS